MNRFTGIILSIIIVFSMQGYGQFILQPITLPADACAWGMGSAAGGIATNSPFSFFVNPAHIGIRSFDNEISYGNAYSNWIKENYNDYILRNNAVTAGISLQKISPRLPDIAVGLGFAEQYFNYGEIRYTLEDGPSGSYTPYDKIDYFTLSAGYRYFAKISGGITLKKVHSDFGDIIYPGYNEKNEITCSLYDWGVFVQIPVADIVPARLTTYKANGLTIKPAVDLNLGFSELNSGEETVSYSSRQAGSALPRMAVGSVGVMLACAVTRNSVELKPVEFNWQLDVLNYLSSGDSSSVRYKSWPGDINFLKNVVLGKSGDKLIHAKGWELHVCEAFVARGGRYHKNQYVDWSTNTSWGIQFAGLVKMARMAGVPINDNTTWGYIINHLDVGYNYSKIETADPYSALNGVDYRDITFRFRL